MSSKFVIKPGGKIEALLNEGIPLDSLGVQTIRRASHVEVTADLKYIAKHWLWIHRKLDILKLDKEYPSKFWADLSPVKGPVLGPFNKRSEALAAEVAWLQENYLVGGRDAKEAEAASAANAGSVPVQ